MIKNPTCEKLDIIILAGQSNAEGSGFGNTVDPYLPTPSVLMLRDEKAVHNIDGILDCDFPRTYEIDIAKENTDGKTTYGNLSLSFAAEYAKNDLEEGRKLLIVNTAVGGTGFTKHHWRVGDCLQVRMMEMVELALKMNKENRVVGLLWHQGEHDAFENADACSCERETAYAANFTRLVKELRELCGNIPVIAGEFVREFTEMSGEKHREACDAVLSALKKVLETEGNGAFVKAFDLKSNNEEHGNGDVYHFSRNSLGILGKRYYEAFASLKK